MPQQRNILLYLPSTMSYSSCQEGSSLEFFHKFIELEDKKVALPHNLYSGAKHIPLFSQWPFHLIVLIGALFNVTRQTQYMNLFFNKKFSPHMQSSSRLDYFSEMFVKGYMIDLSSFKLFLNTSISYRTLPNKDRQLLFNLLRQLSRL